MVHKSQMQLESPLCALTDPFRNNPPFHSEAILAVSAPKQSDRQVGLILD